MRVRPSVLRLLERMAPGAAALESLRATGAP